MIGNDLSTADKGAPGASNSLFEKLFVFIFEKFYCVTCIYFICSQHAILTICICSLLSPQKPIPSICLDIITIPNLQNFAASRRSHWFWHSMIRFCLWKPSCGRKLHQFDINVFDLLINFNSFYNKFQSKDVFIKKHYIFQNRIWFCLKQHICFSWNVIRTGQTDFTRQYKLYTTRRIQQIIAVYSML